MSVEIANVVHVLARLALNNPAVVTEQFGGVTSVTRTGLGTYEVVLANAVDIQQAFGVLQPAAGSARMTSVRVRDYSTFGPANILLETFDAAGAAVEGGNCVLTIFRFPSIEAT